MVALNSESTTLSVASCNLIRRLSVDFSVSAYAPAETLSDSDYPFFGIFIYKSTSKKPKEQVYLDVLYETLCTKILAFSASCTHPLLSSCNHYPPPHPPSNSTSCYPPSILFITTHLLPYIHIRHVIVITQPILLSTSQIPLRNRHHAHPRFPRFRRI